MPRRFTEEEARRIFARVAERQRAGFGSDAGLSLAELTEAARAAGLDSSLVAAAAAELDAVPEERVRFGAPVEVSRSRVVPDVLSDDTWGQIVAAARREFGDAGMAGQIGRLREWTIISGGTKNGIVTRLTAEPTADGTRLTLTKSIQEAIKGLTIATAVQSVLAVLFFVMFLAGVDPELWIPALLLAVIGVGFGVGSQVGSRIWHRQSAGRFEAVLDRMELIARSASALPEESAPDAVADAGRLPTSPDLDLDAFAAEDDAEEIGGRAESRRRARP